MKMKLQNQIRHTSLSSHGFGCEAMNGLKVCAYCSSLEPSSSTVCSSCGKRLPSDTLYDIYRKQHKSCEKCNTVISPDMHFCPRCGKKL